MNDNDHDIINVAIRKIIIMISYLIVARNYLSDEAIIAINVIICTFIILLLQLCYEHYRYYFKEAKLS